MLHIPGAFSRTEVAAALDASEPLVKLFPGGQAGPDYVRDLLKPFPEVRLVATGGINPDNARAPLDAGATALAVGGSLAGARDAAGLTRRYLEAVRDVQQNVAGE